MRELALDPVRPRTRWTRKLDQIVWRTRGVFGRDWYVRREWDESQHPRVPAGSPDGGQFGEGGGGGGESSGSGGNDVKLDPKVIEVGGDQWNQATARKLEREYQIAKPKLDKITSGAVKDSGAHSAATAGWNSLSEDDKRDAFTAWRKENKIDDYNEAKEKWDAIPNDEKIRIAVDHGVVAAEALLAKLAENAADEQVDEDEDEDAPYYPDEWDSMSGDQQTETEEHWKKENYESVHESEVQNYFDNGQALADAKRELAYGFGKADYDWAKDALDEIQDDHDLPFTTEQILDSMELEYKDNHGDGSEDPDMGFDDTKLDKLTPEGADPAQMDLPGMDKPEPSKLLTQDMRDEITEALTKAFNKEADKKSSDMEAPDYIGESVDEYLDQMWGELSDKDKFQHAYDNDIVEKPGSESDEPKSAKTKDNPMRVEALPGKYDPLNETTGADYIRTQRLARYLSVERAVQLIKERGIPVKFKPEDLAADPKLLNDAVAVVDNQLWKEWKGSSTSNDGILLQVATAEELGGRLNLKTAATIVPENMKKYADNSYSKIGGYKGVLAYIRAKWETTQYLLDKAGTQELALYRGINLARSGSTAFDEAMKEKSAQAKQMVDVQYPSGSKNTYTKLPTVKVDRNGAASTTTDINVANGWAGGPGKVTLRAMMPRTAAISIPAYGINVHGEHEVVVAGTAWKGWDAWAGTAPPLDKVPIGPKGSGIGTNAPLQQAA